MKAQFNHVTRKMCRKTLLPARLNGQPKAHRRERPEETIQLICAHHPPAVDRATEQPLRAQIQIEQRAQQLWIAEGCHPREALQDWLRAEREVVQNLCGRLLHWNSQKRDSAPASH